MSTIKCTMKLCSKILVILIIAHTVQCYVSQNNENAPAESQNHVRSRRMLQFLTDQPNKSYQACLTPAGSKGHCKHVQHCSLSEFKQNFWRFLSYLCIIETFSIGVCCPDDIGSAISLPDFDAVVWGVDNKIDAPEPEAIISRPEERGCGLATKTYPKITGGRPADPSEWPWMAALLRPNRAKSFCGGALITDRHVLTAAHCTYKYNANEINVRLGEYDFRVFNETRFRDFRVADIRQHIDFDGTTYDNDISILKLERATLFNTYIWPVCMPPSGETWEAYQGIVTGWGTQFFGGPSSDVLMEVVVPIWTQKRCKSAFTQRISDTVICAGATEGGRDSCQGDSGGPLLIQLPNKRWVIVGVVSWGMRCGEANHPGIYTRVSSFSDWIIENSIF
ncbi:Proclotting enzyme [Pseudolycoriella hygida]|uniref:Phenoloxidase-activating factor 2 n=1 Tax=Pseudolycoriella hygida TaxID=35572 RepID=A0A9Q0MMD4_9DIPT|nr:Proclotting enzyme [Pseudolycoriella hygida]